MSARIARLPLTAVMQPPNLQLRRLVIGGWRRFPELGRAYEQEGPEHVISALTMAFQRLAKLRFADAGLAAAHLNCLVVSIPLNHAMLCGDDRPPRRTALQRHTKSAVRVFLAADRAT